MEKYATYLRAVNVGGSKIIKMDDLRKSFTSLAFKSKADEFAVHGREILDTAPRQGWIRVFQRLHRKTDRRARHHPKLGHDL